MKFACGGRSRSSSSPEWVYGTRRYRGEYHRPVIRVARRADYAKLQDIERRAGVLFREIGMPEIADDDPPSFDHLASGAALYVATDASEVPVGYALVDLVDGHAHLEQISVVPEAGRQGIGTELIDAVVAWARARGDTEVTLTTFRDVPFNAPLYARRGFVVVEEPDWTDGQRAVMAKEKADGLDVTARVVMTRPIA
jgi:GNAT superfamily N-acetyltransferase